MKIKTFLLLSLSLFAGYMTLLSEQVIAQEKEAVEIIDQNGEPVSDVQIQERAEVDVPALPAPPARVFGGAGAKVKLRDGKVMITNPDGTMTELDVPGMRGVTVNRSVQTVVEDGEKKTIVKGKAILIGPDGQRQEIDLDDGEGGEPMVIFERDDLRGMFQFKGGPAELRMVPNRSSKFMIGVHCDSTSEALRSHLELAEGTGLTISQVVSDSPAEKAGLKKHDILMYAGEKELSSIDDLNKAIEAAGNDKEAISVTLIRGGSEMSLDVTPKQRTVPEGFKKGFRDFPVPAIPEMDFEMKELGPGIIIGRSGDLGAAVDGEVFKEMDEIRKRMDQQMKKHMEEVREMQKQMQEEMQRALKDR